MDDDAQAFLEELESRHGAPVGWRTYATWYGNNHSVFREFGVFFYRCEGHFYFEDFERSPSLLGISLKPKKAKAPFVRFEGSFSASDVVMTRPVPKNMARQIIDGKRVSERIRDVNIVDRLFRQMVEMVVLTDGTIHFFELMARKDFIDQINTTL